MGTMRTGAGMGVPNLNGLVNLATGIANFLTGVAIFFTSNMFLTIGLLVVVGGLYLFYKRQQR